MKGRIVEDVRACRALWSLVITLTFNGSKVRSLWKILDDCATSDISVPIIH